MTIFQSVILGIVEGVTEFLPVSSTAHLIVVQRLFGFSESSLFFNTVVQLGALLGLIVAEWKSLLKLLENLYRVLVAVVKKKQKLSELVSDKLIMLGIATLPIMAGGLILSSILETIQNSLLPIVIMSIGVGVVLLIAEKKAGQVEKKVTIAHLLLMGVSQVVALIPGTSRSGIVASAGMMQGMTRGQALEYSFLLSIPALALAGAYELLQSFRGGDVNPTILFPTLVATVVAFISSLFVVNVLRWVVREFGFIPFVIYRVIFGLFILFFLL